MVFVPRTWKNGPEGNTPVDADGLNRLEDGVATAHDLLVTIAAAMDPEPEVARTNLATQPGPQLDTGNNGWGSASSSLYVGTRSDAIVGHPGVWVTQTRQAANPSAVIANFTHVGTKGVGTQSAANMPVTGGEKYAVSVEAMSDQVASVAFEMVYYSGTAVLETLQPSGSPLASPGAPQRVGAFTVAPVGATSLRVNVNVRKQSGVSAGGEIARIRRALVVAGAETTGPYFDGDTDDVAGSLLYEWVGDPGLSTSTETVVDGGASSDLAAVVSSAVEAVGIPQIAAEAASAAVSGGFIERFDEIQTAARERVLQQDFLTAKGNRIGTAGRVPVSIRFDHWLNALGGTVLPLLEARSLPSGLCVYSRMLTPGDIYLDTDSTNYTWADIQSWCLTRGVEIWSHGQSHADTPHLGGIAALHNEIVQSKADLETLMPQVKVQGWMQPGVTPLGGQANGWLGFDSGNPASLTDHPAGRMIRSTYPVSELYMNGVLRAMPGRPLHGADHITLDSLTFASVKGTLDNCVALGTGVEFMLHSGLVGQAGRITLADLTAVLDYIVTLRDAGKIEVVTPSAMYAVDTEASKRLEIVAGGDFGAPFDPATSPGRWTGVAALTTGVDGDRTHLVIPNTGSIITTSYVGVRNLGLHGEMFAVEMEARSTTSAVGRMIVKDSQNAAVLNKTWTMPLTTGWQKFTRFMSIPRETANLQFQFGRNSGGDVHLRGIRVYKV